MSTTCVLLAVWYKTKFGSQNLATKFGNYFFVAVGSLDKWLPIKVANTSKKDKFEWFNARRLDMAPSDCNHL